MYTCDGCGEPIPAMVKYLCVLKTAQGFKVEVGCGHYTPLLVGDQNAMLFGGSDCFYRFIAIFTNSLRCTHS